MSPCACEHEKKDEVAVQARHQSRRRDAAEQSPRVGQLATLEEEVNQGRGVQHTFQLREMLNNPVQRAAAGRVENPTGLSDSLKAGLEQLSGMDLSGVRVHYNSPRPVQLQALAYTQGQEIHVAPGQERHLPHEGWHVVQQMQGRVRPTMQLQGTAINDSPGLEREADVMGARSNRLQVGAGTSVAMRKAGGTDVLQGYFVYSNSETMSQRGLHGISKLLYGSAQKRFRRIAMDPTTTESLLSFLAELDLDPMTREAIDEIVEADGGVLKDWLESFGPKVSRSDTLGRTSGLLPEISQQEWSRLVSLPSLEGEKTEFSPFANREKLLKKIGGQIGKYDSHSLVLGADKDFLYPFWATGSRQATLVSTDVNNPYLRTRDLMVRAGLAYPLSPPSVLEHSAQESSVHVTSGVKAHAFYLVNSLYGDFFAEQGRGEKYDFILDKSSYLGMDLSGLSQFVQSLKGQGYWISNFTYLDQDQVLLLKLLGLQDVTSKVVSAEEAQSFPGETLHIYKKVRPLPKDWIKVVHAWFGKVRPILDATRMGRSGIPIYASTEREEDQFQTDLLDSKVILSKLEELIAETDVKNEMRQYLEMAYAEMQRALQENIFREWEEYS